MLNNVFIAITSRTLFMIQDNVNIIDEKKIIIENAQSSKWFLSFRQAQYRTIIIAGLQLHYSLP